MRSSLKIFLILVLFLFCFNKISFCAKKDEGVEEKKKKLLQVQEEISKEKEREQKARTTESNEKKALGGVKQGIDKTKKEIDKYQKNLVVVHKHIKIAEINLKKKEDQFFFYQKLFKDQTVNFFRNSWKYLLRSPDDTGEDIFFSDIVSLNNEKNFSKNFSRFRYVAVQDSLLISQAEFQKKSINLQKTTLEKKETNLLSSKTNKEKEKKVLLEQQKAKESAILSAQKELKLSLKRQEELKKTASQLQSMIKSLAAKKGVSSAILKKEAMVFEKGKDNLPWPVSSGKVISYFGWTSSSSYSTSLYNPGIDIEVQKEQNVVSVNTGKVIFSGTFRSYGNTVIVDHGGSYCSVYSGLNSILVKTNQELKSGETLGSIVSVLHFEMRKDSKVIDPLEWLKNKQ